MIETVVRETRRSNGSEKNMSQFSFRGSPNTQNAKNAAKQEAINGTAHCFQMDLQAVKLLPKIEASKAYYKQKLQIHNYTVYNLKTHDANNYWFTENNGNLEASTFTSLIIHFLETNIQDQKKIYLITDGCGYQNRNAVLSNALLKFSAKKNIVIEHLYLEPGHTQMECDHIHSLIERGIKNKDLYCPNDFVDATINARKNPSPLNAIELSYDFFKNYNKCLKYSSIRPGTKTGESQVKDIRALKYENSIISYKLSHNTDEVWKSLSNVSSAPPSPPIAPMAVTSSTTVPPGARSTSPCSATSNGPPNGNSRCCDTGRPLFTDPITGQTVCSCQYDLINYQRLASVGMAGGGGPGMPLSMYSTPYSAETMAAYFPALGGDQPPFYTNAAGGMELKENLAGGPWPYPPVYPSYDAALAGYHFNGYPMDLNGARRKNATRETTSTLKAWLNEHKKNPYPTKGEKIMLAIITKMTLTQVSTWFANARRRLKKENKMTWEPRNRVEDDDVNLDDDDHKSNDDKDMLDSGTGSSEDGDRPSRMDMLDRPSGNHVDWNESRNGSGPNSPDIYDRPGAHHLHPPHPLFHPSHMHHLRPPHPTGSPPNPNQTTSSTNSNAISKPRIWSLADMASKESKDDSPSANSANLYHSSAGKIISPLAARGLHPLHHPYMRPELYRNFYGPTSAHDAAILESYQRTFGATLGHNGIPGVPLSSVLSKGSPFGPLSLTTSPQVHHQLPPQSRASPASSTSSTPEHLTPEKSSLQPASNNNTPINVTKP